MFGKLRLVQSIINYGAAVWGDREFASVAAVQNRASRYFLGLGRYAHTAAVRGDMGWSTPAHRQWMAVTRQWCRLVNMNNTRLNKRIFCWAHEKAQARCRNWIFRVQQFYRGIHMDHMANVGYHFDVSHCLQDMDVVLFEHYEVLWVAELSRVTGRNNTGRNKLRTYRQFKTEFKVEPYVMEIMSVAMRDSMAKFRSGTAPIHLETGRYMNIREADRLCLICNQGTIENELHTLTECAAFTDIRNHAISSFNDITPGFLTQTNQEQLLSILSDERLARPAAKYCQDILDCRRRHLYI